MRSMDKYEMQMLILRSSFWLLVRIFLPSSSPWGFESTIDFHGSRKSLPDMAFWDRDDHILVVGICVSRSRGYGR